jgi:hypothetical protein
MDSSYHAINSQQEVKLKCLLMFDGRIRQVRGKVNKKPTCQSELLENMHFNYMYIVQFKASLANKSSKKFTMWVISLTRPVTVMVFSEWDKISVPRKELSPPKPFMYL